jgi:alpha-acetolactate decarboxylase
MSIIEYDTMSIPTHYEYEYDSDFDSFSVPSFTTETTSNSKKKKHIITEPLAPLEHTVYIKVKGKKVKIKIHETIQHPNAKIINAVTGIPVYDDDDTKYKYVVGSRQEDDLFKVKMVSGVNGKGVLLFYESPEQYEKHFACTVNEDIKKKWNDKSTRYRNQVRKERNK